MLVAAVLVAGVAAAVAAGASGAAAKKPVAFWTVDARIVCASPSCSLLPKWMASLRNPMKITVFADGTMYYEAEVFAVGRNGPKQCDKTLFSKPFSGTCHVADFGTGFLRKTSIPGLYKGLDFWVESETAAFGSKPALQVNPFSPYPIDTGNPAWVGHHTLADFVAKPAAGEALVVDVTKTPV